MILRTVFLVFEYARQIWVVGPLGAEKASPAIHMELLWGLLCFAAGRHCLYQHVGSELFVRGSNRCDLAFSKSNPHPIQNRCDLAFYGSGLVSLVEITCEEDPEMLLGLVWPARGIFTFYMRSLVLLSDVLPHVFFKGPLLGPPFRVEGFGGSSRSLPPQTVCPCVICLSLQRVLILCMMCSCIHVSD